MKLSLRQLTFSAVMAAIVFVVTRFIQIPIPLGYFNVGNCIILAGCVLLPSPCGIYAGAIGSALADLTSYPEYTIPTLIIKTLLPLVFYLLIKVQITKKPYVNKVIAAAIATLIPLFGYTITGGIFYGGFVAGLAQFPGLFLEYIANLVLFALLLPAVSKIRIDV